MFCSFTNFFSVVGVGDKPSSNQLYLTSKIESYFSDNEGAEDQPSKHTRLQQYSDAYSNDAKVDKAVKGLLETSDILEEKVYGTNKNEVFLQLPEGIGNKYIEQHSPLDHPLILKEIPSPISTQRRVIRLHKGQKGDGSLHRYADGYKNSILINQVPLVNGMDGRSINNITDLYHAVKKYKIVTSLIEKHLNQEEHILSQLITQFEVYFVKRYSPSVDLFKQGNSTMGELESCCNKATVDLQQFIIVMYEAVNEFYCLGNLIIGKQVGQDTLFNRNNIINFITSIIFKPTIHDTIFDLYSAQVSDIEQIYRKNLKYCSALHPQDFGVSELYCLNEKTESALRKIQIPTDVKADFILKNSQGKSVIEDNGTENLEEEKTEQSPEINSHKRFSTLHKGLEIRKNSARESQDITNNNEPYGKAIKALQNLPNKRSPIRKLKTIVKVAELVNECIETFYQRCGTKNEEKLSGDQTLAIFMYIIARAQVNDVRTHCKIIEKFSTSNILSSVSGYYAVTLEACVNYICDMELQENFSVELFGAGIKEFMNSLGKGSPY